MLIGRDLQHDGRGQLEPVVEHVHRDGRGHDHPAPATFRVVVPLQGGPLPRGQRHQRARVGLGGAAAATTATADAHKVVRHGRARPVVGRPVLGHVDAVALHPDDHHGPSVAPRHHVHVAVQLGRDRGGHGRRLRRCRRCRRRRRRSFCHRACHCRHCLQNARMQILSQRRNLGFQYQLEEMFELHLKQTNNKS